MIQNEREIRHELVLQAARRMMTAARSAPNGKGIDIIEIAMVTDGDILRLSDEMIRTMAERGGLVGLNYCAGFLDDQPSPDLCRSTTALMAKHAAHFKQVGGIEIIGLGSDFDGIGGKLEMDDCSKLPLLADALRREGFTEDEVEAIFYRNARRFFEENL